jgi:hypothetical protein
MGGFLRLPALYKRKELPGSSDASAATPAEPVVKRPALAHPSAFQRAGDTIQVLKGPTLPYDANKSWQSCGTHCAALLT